MTSATNTNNTHNKFGTVLRAIACILCIITIPNVGWAYNGCNWEDTENDCIFSTEESNTYGYECEGNPNAGDRIVGKAGRVYVLGDGYHAGGLIKNAAFECDEGISDEFKVLTTRSNVICTASPIKQFQNSSITKQNNAPANAIVKIKQLSGGDRIDTKDEPGIYVGMWKADERNQYCFWIDCKEEFEPSADKKSCIPEPCKDVNGNPVTNGQTEIHADLCNGLDPNDPLAATCQHTCTDNRWGPVTIATCVDGYALADGKCVVANCKNNGVDYNIDDIVNVTCTEKYAKQCTKKCIAGNDGSRHWGDTVIVSCIDDAIPVRTNGAITKCFLDKPYNDAIAKLEKLLDDITNKCGNDGEHIPQNDTEPEPHVPNNMRK